MQDGPVDARERRVPEGEGGEGGAGEEGGGGGHPGGQGDQAQEEAAAQGRQEAEGQPRRQPDRHGGHREDGAGESIVVMDFYPEK